MQKLKSFYITLQNYLRMIKFSHTIFALPFAGIAVVEVYYWNIDKDSKLFYTSEIVYKVLGVLVCMVSLRSAAMGFNRIVDWKFDKENPRTKNREIPSGKISLRNASIFVILFSIIFVLSAFLINPLAGILSPIAILITFGYSYTKRFTYLCHYILGFAIGLAPIGVWIALTSSISIEAILISIALWFYIAGFDILYSIMDIEFDQKKDLFSIPSRFGIPISLWIARINHMISFIAMIGLGIMFQFKWIYFIAIVVVLFLFLIEHYLVQKSLNNIPIAFFHINSFISTILFFGLLFDRILFHY